MKKRRGKLPASWTAVFVLLGLIDLAVVMGLMLKGHDIALFHPKGLIAQDELGLIELTSAVLSAIAIPSLFLFYFFAWKYRETNPKATYDPTIRHGKRFMITIWAIPCFVMVVMSCIMWTSTQKLDPHKPIASTTKTLTVQVIALRWKWLFIYPEQRVASVNFVMLPESTPVQFELTADDAPMSSFWIPHLAGQLYAMTGHVNTLNIVTDTPGDYEGQTAEINGAGYAGMKFTARVDTQDAFNDWAKSTAQSYPNLDASAYAKLLAPSENNPQQYFNSPSDNLYDKVVMKYMGSHDMTQAAYE